MRFKTFLFIFCGIGVILGVSQAAPIPLEIPQTSKVPVGIRASIARGDKTWFFGKLPTEFSKHETWLHLGSIEPHRTASKSDLNSNTLFGDYRLTLWKNSGTTRKPRFRRLSFVEFSGAEFLQGILVESDAEYTKIKADAFWLREATKQTPIVRLSVLTGNGLNASTAGADLLFVFCNGLQKPPQVQQFNNYFELLESASHSYEKTDNQGILKVKRENRVQVGMDAPIVKTITEFRWNGREFVAEPQVTFPPQPQ